MSPGQDEDQDWTLALCIRCASLYPAHLERCPFCSDLVITVRNIADDDAPPDWSCKITGTGGVILRFDHARDAGYAHDKAHEFLRRYVAQRRRQQQQP